MTILPLIPYIVAFVTALATYVWRNAPAHTRERLAHIEQCAMRAVQYVEQTGAGLSNPAKLKTAEVALRELLALAHIQVSDALLTILLETAVEELHRYPAP